MIITITESKLFTQDPDVRFSKEYLVPLGTWKELWRRYKLMDYTSEDLRDYFFIKHARKINHKGMKRWILRSEVYTVTNPLIKKGVQHVNTEIFNQYEQFVMDELTKQLRYGGALYDSKTII